MFAVKGWSVDPASLKPQTEIFKSSKQQDGELQKSSKKRKRGHLQEAKQDPNVRADDVGRLWEQHIEGKGPSKSQKQRERKKQKTENTSGEQTGHSEPQHQRRKPKEGKETGRRKVAVLDSKPEKNKAKKKDQDKKRVREDQGAQVIN